MFPAAADVERFIAERGVTRCPPAHLVPSHGDRSPDLASIDTDSPLVFSTRTRKFTRRRILQVPGDRGLPATPRDYPSPLRLTASEIA